MAPSQLEKLQSAVRLTPMRSILDGQKMQGAVVNVAGIAVDFQSPMPTRGSDWKCTIRLFDKSTEGSKEDAISVVVFRDESSMPRLQHNDLVVITQAKVQKWQGETSLLTNHNTIIRLYAGSQIHRPPLAATSDVSRSSYPKNFSGNRAPSKAEAEYVSHLYHSLDKDDLPESENWVVQQVQSSAMRDKFSELGKIKVDSFHDLIVQVVRCFDVGDKMSLWVSDYTENDAFFNHNILGSDVTVFQDGDEYGYGAKFLKPPSTAEKQWDGPFGKRSMQLSCWDDHAAAIRDNNITVGDWVMVKNVQIKYGRNYANLEGFVREDKNRVGATKVNIFQLDHTASSENMDPRLKEAIRRKRDYERERKKALKDIEEASNVGQKRKAALGTENPSGENSKKRRSKARAGKRAAGATAPSEPQESDTVEQIAQNSHQSAAPEADVNPHIKCENHQKKVSAIVDILKPSFHYAEIDGEKIRIPLPFANRNYRAHVRVTDFHPPDLRDFAVLKRSSEYDALSDNEDSDYDSDGAHSENSLASRVWEWRFLLQLEDASDEQNERIWVVVDNQSAQLLTYLDASDLKNDNEGLARLQESLAIIWGNLAEKKEADAKEPVIPKRIQRSRGADGPPPDSSDVEDANGDDTTTEMKLSNRPFLCCIRQYGVKVREEDPALQDAGENYRWEPVYGMYGTRISS